MSWSKTCLQILKNGRSSGYLSYLLINRSSFLKTSTIRSYSSFGFFIDASEFINGMIRYMPALRFKLN